MGYHRRAAAVAGAAQLVSDTAGYLTLLFKSQGYTVSHLPSTLANGFQLLGSGRQGS